MRRLSLWLRSRPMVGDGLLSVVVVLLSVVLLSPQAHRASYLLISLLLSAPLVIRRRYPELAAALVLALGAGQLILMPDTVVVPADLALAIVLYTLVNYVGRRAGLVYGIGLLIGTVLWSLWRAYSPGDMIVALMVFALAWVLAEFAGARRAYAAEVEMRLAESDRDRDRRAAIAVTDERTRIARELHDVVAHAVSIMVVQADGASYVLPRDPSAVAPALTIISSTGRAALTELRRTLELLRTDHAGALTPQPGTVGLGELAQRMESVGLSVELELRGDLDTMPAGLALGVYRIVQESLTNVLRHAGPGATAKVRVHSDERQVMVEITDTGQGTGDFDEGSGNGLLGMRERVAVLGGSITVGSEPDVGWAVRAILPLNARPHDEEHLP
ncbi:MAG: sensor histidine kinase [Mycobacteriaceae bacterium]